MKQLSTTESVRIICYYYNSKVRTDKYEIYTLVWHIHIIGAEENPTTTIIYTVRIKESEQ